MASSMSHLVSTNASISTEEQAAIARMLIQANELYSISNSLNYSSQDRKTALEESTLLTRDVLKTLPNHHAALNLLARIELDQANFDTAEQLLKRAIEIVEHDENTMLNLGYLFIAKRQYAEAESWFKKALSENRHSAKAFSGMALIRLKQKEYLSAFKHYLRLIELGYENDRIRAHFLDAIEYLSCDAYSADLERTCIAALNWENQDTAKLSNFVSSLLIQKYDLLNENALLDLNILIQDQLLIQSLEQVLLPKIEVENLVTELRKAILNEISLTRDLRDQYLPLAIAIGVYASRTDYALITTQDEESNVAILVDTIQQVVQSKWDMEDLIGALIIVSMYEPLYTQRFSTQLLRYEACDWPNRIQQLLEANLYELCTEHQTSFDLIDSSIESLLSDEIKRCSDRWNRIENLPKANLYETLSRELKTQIIPERFKDNDANILLVGCGSGLRAFYLSQVFENVRVVAVDSSRANITYTRMMANQLGVTDIQFIHSSYDDTIIGDELFDIIEFNESLNHSESPAQMINDWKSLLKQDGLVRLSLNTHKLKNKLNTVIQLVKDRRLSPTADNIRHLRYAINQEAGSGLWDALFEDSRFYTGAGCKELFFNKHNSYFNLADLEQLLNDVRLDFIRFVDIPAASLTSVDTYQPEGLKGWKILDQDDTLFGDSIELYCSNENQ